MTTENRPNDLMKFEVQPDLSLKDEYGRVYFIGIRRDDPRIYLKDNLGNERTISAYDISDKLADFMVGAMVALIKQLDFDEHYFNVQYAEQMLGYIRDYRGAEALIFALRNGRDDIRRQARGALWLIGRKHKQLLDDLTPLLEDENEEVRNEAAMLIEETKKKWG